MTDTTPITLLKVGVWRFKPCVWETLWVERFNWSVVKCPRCKEPLGDTLAKAKLRDPSHYYFNVHNCRDGNHILLRAYF